MADITKTRKYYDGREIVITPGIGVCLHVRLPDGEVLEDVEPRRFFPISDAGRYIALVDKDCNEIAVIRDVSKLDNDSRRCLKKALSKFYMIPKIIDIVDVYDKTGLLRWKVETDRGPFEFDIQNRYSDIKLFPGGRVLIRDSSDNRYEIPDYRKLSSKSQYLLMVDL